MFYVFIRQVGNAVTFGLLLVLVIASYTVPLTPVEITIGAFAVLVETVLFDWLFIRPTRR